MNKLINLKALVKDEFNINAYPNITSKTCHFPQILLVGEGQFGLDALTSFIELKNTQVVAYIDEALSNKEFTYDGIKLISLSQAQEQYSKLPIISAVKNNFLMAEILFQYFEQVFMYRPSLPDLLKNEQYLADQQSKFLLKQHSEILHGNVYIKEFSNDAGTQYDHNIVYVEPNEQIICVGPYYGNPLQAFAKKAENNFYVHCLEANPYVYAQLCRNIILWGMKGKVVPVCAGAWSDTGMVAFAGEGHTGGGNVSHSEINFSPCNLDMAIYAYALDDYIEMTGFKPTLIESGRIGIATEVIKGAENYIKKNKPKLILLDFPYSDTPAILKALVPEYKIYYSECNRINYGAFFACL